MQILSSTERTHNLSILASERFDVLVIGGGVTGVGVALDAAARGYKVALVEKVDFASGTSSKATKLVHGGIRYLPNFDIALVREALVERGLLLHPLAFVLPLYKGDHHPVGMRFTTLGGIGLSLILDIGLWFYDALAGRRNVSRHRRLSRAEVLKCAPYLVSAGLEEGFVYYDAQTNDARLTMALIRTAAQYGATITNYTEVTSFISEQGKLCGASVHDHSGNQELALRARHIVNATGVFNEQIEVEPSKGVQYLKVLTTVVRSSSFGRQADQAQLRVPLSLANVKRWIQGLLEQPSGFAKSAYLEISRRLRVVRRQTLAFYLLSAF